MGTGMGTGMGGARLILCWAMYQSLIIAERVS